MHFLLVAVGSVGDVYPFFGIGHCLKQRGHRVTAIVNPYYESQVRDLQLEFLPLGTLEQQMAMVGHPDAWHPVKGWQVWMKLGGLAHMEELYEIVQQNYVRDQTAVLGSWGAVGARIAQERLGIPMATMYIEEDKFHSVHDTSVHANLGFLSPITRFRGRLGLPNQQHLANWMHSPLLTFGLFPDWWAPRQPGWPAQAVLTGYPLWDQSTQRELPDDVAEFVTGENPIVFTPGAVNLQAGRFFEESTKVCEELGVKAMFLTTYSELLPKQLPSNVRHWKYVPFGALLRHAALVVHHAGSGTMWQCLAAGVPQVVMPTMHFHYDNAMKLEQFGVGRSLPPRHFKQSRLADVLKQLLGSDATRKACDDVASRLQGLDPHKTICDHMEALLPQATGC